MMISVSENGIAVLQLWGVSGREDGAATRAPEGCRYYQKYGELYVDSGALSATASRKRSAESAWRDPGYAAEVRREMALAREARGVGDIVDRPILVPK
jgi:hypothetical protein